jgi:hypothetical protein
MASTLFKFSPKSSTACDPNRPVVSDRIADHTSKTHAVELSQREGLCCRSGFMRTRRKYYTDLGQWQSEKTVSLLTWLYELTLQDDVKPPLTAGCCWYESFTFTSAIPPLKQQGRCNSCVTIPCQQTNQPKDDQATSQFNQKTHTRNVNTVFLKL